MKRYSFFTIILLLSAIFSYGVTGGDGTLSGKNVALLGDSMTWIGGDSCNVARGWSSHFRRLASPASVSVYARSGATWTNAPGTKIDTGAFYDVLHDDNVLYTKAVRLLLDVKSGICPAPDVVILYAGGNDAWFADRRPGIFDSAEERAEGALPTGLFGSVVAVCRILQKEWPQARLVLVTPAQMVQAPAAVVERVSATIDSAGQALGIEVIRTDRYGPVKADEERRKPRRFTTDGIHTNPDGASALARFIIGELESSHRDTHN